VKYFFCFFTLIFPALLTAVENDVKTIDSARVYRVPSITVSSTRAKSENSPVPFAEISKSEISKTYSSQDLPQILSELPSILTFSENGNGIGYTNLSMRGFDQRRISVMVNGIPQNDPSDHNFYWINLSDFASTVENVHVQRGAGLSSYGPAAIGGSILLSTVNFVNFKGVNISSGIGFQEYGAGSESFNQISSRYAIEYSSGLTDNYAFYAKLGRINSFGYREQSWANLNSYFFSAMRFDGNLTTQLNIYGGSQTDGLAYNGVPYGYIKDLNLRKTNYNYFSYDRADGQTIDWTTKRREQEVENFSQPQIELLNDWQISDKLVFKSAAFFKLGEGYFDYDGTGWTTAQSFRLTPENGFIEAEDPRNPIIRSFVGNKTFGWIPKIELEHTDGKFMLGAEVRIHRSEHWGKINYADNLPTNFNPDYKFYSYNGIRNIFSIFASEHYIVTDNLTLNIEGQLVSHLYAIENEKAGNVYTSYKTTDGKTISNGERLFDINYLFFNPRFGVNYSFDEYKRVYFSTGLTSREPRMNNLYAASDSWDGKTPLFENSKDDSGNVYYNFSKPFVKPEQMLNFEIGWAYRDDNYSFNINGYWMEYFDELVKSGQLDNFGAPIDGNAPKTRHYGIEIMGSAKIIESQSYGNLQISTNGTYSKNLIEEYNFISKNGDVISLKGNSIAGFPDLIANIRLSYNYGQFFTSLYLKNVGEFRTDNFGDMLVSDPRIKAHLGGEYYLINTVDTYTIMNADFSYTFTQIPALNRLKIHLQINNITNELYAASGIGKEFFPAAERNYFMGIEIGL
jgi:iron complex outermembrane receptor protein